MNEKLKRAKKLWDIKSDWKRNAMPEVLAYNKQYRKDKPDNYPYNDSIIKFILEREKIDYELVDFLGTEVYLSQHDIDQEKKAEYKTKMLNEGWLELNKETMNTAIELGKKLQVNATSTMDWLTTKIDNVYKPLIAHNGEYMLMKPRARTRGYYLHQFENAFCKLV